MRCSFCDLFFPFVSSLRLDVSVQLCSSCQLEIPYEVQGWCDIVSVNLDHLVSPASHLYASGGLFNKLVCQFISFNALVGRDPMEFDVKTLRVGFSQNLDDFSDYVLF